MNNIISLNKLEKGRKGKVMDLISYGDTRRRMLDLGIIVDTIIEALHKSPSGDPTAYQIRGAVIALRKEEANKILIKCIN